MEPEKLNNIAIFLVPGPQNPEDEDEAIFMSFIADSDTLSEAVPYEELVKSFPENWDDTAIVHLWDINKVLTDMETSPDFGTSPDSRQVLADAGVSHVAVLESTVIPPDSVPFRLGSHDIKGNSMFLMYSADKNKYILFHCARCGYTFTKWLESKQPEWFDVESSGFQDPRASLN